MTIEEIKEAESLLESLLSEENTSEIKKTAERNDLNYINYHFFDKELYIEYLIPANDYEPRLERVMIKPLNDLGVSYELESVEFMVKFKDLVHKRDMRRFQDLMNKVIDEHYGHKEVSLTPVTQHLMRKYCVDCEITNDNGAKLYFMKKGNLRRETVTSEYSGKNRLVVVAPELENVFELWDEVTNDFKQGLNKLGLEYVEVPGIEAFEE